MILFIARHTDHLC